MSASDNVGFFKELIKELIKNRLLESLLKFRNPSCFRHFLPYVEKMYHTISYPVFYIDQF